MKNPTARTTIGSEFKAGAIIFFGGMSWGIMIASLVLTTNILGCGNKRHTKVEIVQLKNGQVVATFESTGNSEGDTYQIAVLGLDTVRGTFKNGKWEDQ